MGRKIVGKQDIQKSIKQSQIIKYRGESNLNSEKSCGHHVNQVTKPHTPTHRAP